MATRNNAQTTAQKVAEYEQAKEWRPTAAIVAVNPLGKVAIVMSAKGHRDWNAPRGGIDPGFTIAETVADELRDELGWEESDYEILSTGFLDRTVPYGEGRKKRGGFSEGKVYLGVLVATRHPAPSFALNPEEVAGAAWVTEAEAHDYFDLGRPAKATLSKDLLAEARKQLPNDVVML